MSFTSAELKDITLVTRLLSDIPSVIAHLSTPTPDSLQLAPALCSGRSTHYQFTSLPTDGSGAGDGVGWLDVRLSAGARSAGGGHSKLAPADCPWALSPGAVRAVGARIGGRPWCVRLPARQKSACEQRGRGSGHGISHTRDRAGHCRPRMREARRALARGFIHTLGTFDAQRPNSLWDGTGWTSHRSSRGVWGAWAGPQDAEHRKHAL